MSPITTHKLNRYLKEEKEKQPTHISFKTHSVTYCAIELAHHVSVFVVTFIQTIVANKLIEVIAPPSFITPLDPRYLGMTVRVDIKLFSFMIPAEVLLVVMAAIPTILAMRLGCHYVFRRLGYSVKEFKDLAGEWEDFKRQCSYRRACFLEVEEVANGAGDFPNDLKEDPEAGVGNSSR